MQPFNEIEKHYEKPDPWGCRTNPDDLRRRKFIRRIAQMFAPETRMGDQRYIAFNRALDIGAGEGWISECLPALEIHGYELSNNAAARFPGSVQRVSPPDGKYDLVTACGIWYGHYNWPHFLELVRAHASEVVVVSGIASWFHPSILDIGTEIFRAEFPYPAGKQQIRVFEVPK